MKKHLHFITIASFLTVLFGIAGNIASYYQIGSYDKFKDSKILPLITSLSPLNLNIKTNTDKIDVWEIFLVMLLLLGAILFILKKGKETRLIGFVFSIIFIGSISSILIKLFNLSFLLKGTYQKPSFVFFYFGFAAIISVIYAFVSYFILKKIKNEKEFDIVITETSKKYQDTGKWQRFFHWLIDSLIIALVFIPIIYTIVFRLYIQDESGNLNIERFENYHKIFANNFLTLGLIVLLRFIYYPIFEILFGSTPAKFLTESRVITIRTENPGASTIFTRTLCRNIPFDSISFFWKTGWHDSLAYSYVVKEKRTGFETSKLLWVFAIFVVYISTYFFGIDFYKDYQNEKLDKNRKELVRQSIANSVKNINLDQIYILEPLYDPSHETLILKIKNIDGDIVEATKIEPTIHHYSSIFGFKEALKSGEVDKRPIYLKKQDFMDAVPKEKYPNSDVIAPKGTYYTINGVHYKIEKEYDISSPAFKFDTQTRSVGKEEGFLVFVNFGTAGKIVSVKNVFGNLEFKDQFPVTFSGYDPNNSEGHIIKLKTGYINFDDSYVFNMEVVDSQNRKLYYQVSILKSGAEIDQIK